MTPGGNCFCSIRRGSGTAPRGLPPNQGRDLGALVGAGLPVRLSRPPCPPAPASQTRLRVSASLPHAARAGQLGDDWPRSCGCVSPRGPPPCLANPDLVPSSPALWGRGVGLAPGGQPLPPSQGCWDHRVAAKPDGSSGSLPWPGGTTAAGVFSWVYVSVCGCVWACACVHLCICVCVMCVPACLCGLVHVHWWVSLHVDTCFLCVCVSVCISACVSCVLMRECTHPYSHRPAE